MRTNLKKLFAVLLTVALVATMFVMPAGAAQIYADFVDTTVFNGDFETGVAGTTPYGWQYYASSNAALLNSKPSTWYADYSVAFDTVVEKDGNKAASFAKKGAGYYYMASKPVTVTGGAEYVFSFDYKLTEAYDARGEGYNFIDNWAGIRFAINQYDAEGNKLHKNNGEVYNEETNNIISAGAVVTYDEYVQAYLTSARGDNIATEVMDGYRRYTVKITLAANTKSVELYLGMGAFNQNCCATVLFDNVRVDLASGVDYDKSDVLSYDLFNGDFNTSTYYADGGKAFGVEGPAGWTLQGTESNGWEAHASYGNNYMATIGTETDGTGTVNKYLEFGWTDTARKSGNVKGYANLWSEKIYVTSTGTSASNQTRYDLKWKLRSVDNDGDDTVMSNNTWTPYVKVYYFDADGNFVMNSAGTSPQVNAYRYGSHGAVTVTPTEWTDYSSSFSVPVGTVYMKVAFWLGGGAGEQIETTYHIDDVKIEYTGRYVQNTIPGFFEQSVTNGGLPNSAAGLPNGLNTYNHAHELTIVNDPDRGNVYMVTGSDAARATSSQGAEGYACFWNNTLIPVTAGKALKFTYDTKDTGWDLVTGTVNGNVQKAQVRIRYYDANGDLILNGTNALVHSARGTNVQANRDWTTETYSFTIPTGAVYAQYGFFSLKQNIAGTAMIEQYYDNISIVMDGKEMLNDNLFDYVILGNGNDFVVEGDDVATLANLVKMNNTATSLNNAPYQSSEEAAYDMNLDGRVTAEDITLLRWKLLGITNEADAVQ